MDTNKINDTPRANNAIYRCDGLLNIDPEFARQLERELNEVKAIFPKILEALGSGCCSPDASIQFLQEIPREVGLAMKKKEMELAKLRVVTSELAHASFQAQHFMEQDLGVSAENVYRRYIDSALSAYEAWKR